MCLMEDVVKCRVCGSYISFDTGYQYTPCACGAVAVDGGSEYTRIIGNKQNWEIVATPVEKED